MAPNRLINETSPYLLQHAHNPVNWYPWGPEALQKAKEEHKPVLLSIGYSACHWCHVMERESFENEETAAIMNEHFICIKIDREERPDLDHIYMDAVQALTGGGGWPLHVFLTPDLKPFYGGTYFPPERMYNRPSWKEVLLNVSRSYTQKGNEIISQAENLTAWLEQSNEIPGITGRETNLFTAEKIKEAYDNLMKQADGEWGGFGTAPKFPQTFVLRFLLSYSYHTGEPAALAHALLSLDKMMKGGMYDQIGGGFARYATDQEWRIPHFEKMLYDNALLLSVYCDTFQLTGQESYRGIIDETMQFIQTEMMNTEGGFFTALDADSEGKEGKFYTWTYEELKNIVKDDTENFASFYQATRPGNWEHTNILYTNSSPGKLPAEQNSAWEASKKQFAQSRKTLLAERNKRVRPGLDDKLLLGWNALMNTACSKAFAVTGNENYRRMALQNMNFLFRHFTAGEEQGFYHSWRTRSAGQPAFLDDYAFLIRALMDLQEITADQQWLWKAKRLAEFVEESFSDAGSVFFNFTGHFQTDVIIRKKEIYDGATASGNSVMAQNLLHLGMLFDLPAWKKKSTEMIAGMEALVTRYPLSFGNWLNLLTGSVFGTSEIAVTGPDISAHLPDILKIYMPDRILMASAKPDPSFPLLKEKQNDPKTTIYLCRDYTCQKPVFSTGELREQLAVLRGQNISKKMQ